jgi:AcrR family transcriptional regulator
MDNVNPPSRSRGRPRSAEARAAVLQAAAELLDSLGPGGVTIAAVAAKARVGKPTIYRTWPNAQALAMAALMAQSAPATGSVASGNPMDDLRLQLRRVVENLATRRGRQLAQMVAAAEPDGEIAKAFRHQVILKSRNEGRELLGRAVAAGQVRADIEVEVALDMIYGPLFYRLLVGHAPLDSSFADQLLTTVQSGLRHGP